MANTKMDHKYNFWLDKKLYRRLEVESAIAGQKPAQYLRALLSDKFTSIDQCHNEISNDFRERMV